MKARRGRNEVPRSNAREGGAKGMEQCLVILLEARARECIGVASRKA